MTDVMSRVDAPAELRMVPYTFLRMFGSQPDVVASTRGGLGLLANRGAALAVTVPWGAIVAGSARDDGVLELRSRNRPTEGVTLQPDEWSAAAPAWAWPTIRAASRLRAAGFAITGATLVVHTGLPGALSIPTAAAATAATTRAFIDLYALPADAATSAVGSPVVLPDRAADLAALADGGAVLARSDTTVDRLPWNPAAAGLRLLVVESGNPELVGNQSRDGDVQQAAQALRRGDLFRFGRLLPAPEPDTGPAAAAAAANDAGALGATLVGDPARPALGVLLHAADLPRIRAAIRAALPPGDYRPRFLTAGSRAG
ncbi:hypothetical protein [Actinoplanes couchii]|uniref:Galactokinase n=1 Tax=Actinoplanes couchii TaxID=403638 RepID=A0ABQ3X7Y1_9ACTN|nr:hypothetical protein [Actinoplanes couchii]MDR6320363.1 galactokinase [Actinoplanes couchii]GID54624.1 hypothetical protein Aco03nite_030280 [Actinoplanes couchii]